MLGTRENAVKNILITGASSGIGAACAHFLAAQGYRVFAGVRNLKTVPPQPQTSALQYVRLDVTQARDWLDLRDKIEAKFGTLYALINNAGLGMGGPAVYLDPERFRASFEVNYFAVLTGIQTCYPLLKASDRAYLIQISSVNGQLPTPFLAPYCSSKAALESLSECLRHELKPWNIHSVIVQPGVVRTPIFDKARRDLAALRSELPPSALRDYAQVFHSFERLLQRVPQQGVAPERVARRIGRILQHPAPRLRYAVGWDAHIALRLNRYLPASWLERLQSRLGP